jgi:hypothetical protein
VFKAFIHSHFSITDISYFTKENVQSTKLDPIKKRHILAQIEKLKDIISSNNAKVQRELGSTEEDISILDDTLRWLYEEMGSAAS